MKIFRHSDIAMTILWLLAFACSIPWINPPEYGRLAALVFIVGFAIVALGRDLAGPGLRFSATLAFWAPVLLWLLALASVAWSAAPMESLLAFATLTFGVAGMAAFAASRGIFRGLILLVPPLYVGLAGLSLWAMAQYFVLPQLLVNGQVRLPFANPNNLSALLMLGLMPACGIVLSATKNRIRIAAMLVAMILLAGIVIVNGRAVLGLSVAGLVALAILCRGRGRTALGGLALVALAGIVAFGAQLLAASPARMPAAPARFGLLMDAGNGSVRSRLALWRATLHLIRDHWFAGTGYGTFHLFYPQYRLRGDAVSAGYMAHDDALQLTAELGVGAALILIILAASALVRMARVVRRTSPASGERAVCLALFLGCGLVAAEACVDFEFYCAGILCLFGLFYGLWLRYSGLALAEPVATVLLPASADRRIGWAIIALPLILLLIPVQGFLRSGHLAGLAENSLIAQDWESFQRQVDAARAAGFGRDARPYMLAAELPLGILESKGDTLSQQARSALLQNADGLLNHAESCNSRLVGIYYGRAVLAQYGFDSHADGKGDARALLRQALVIDPAHYPSRMRLAALELQAGDAAAALETLRGGMTVTARSDPSAFYAMAAEVARQQDKRALAREAQNRLEQWRAGHSTAADAPATPAAPIL